MADRFVVRELEGWKITPAAAIHYGGRPGLTVWVADEAYYGHEVRVWRSEGGSVKGRHSVKRRDSIRSEARELADSLNANHEAAEASFRRSHRNKLPTAGRLEL